MSGTLPKIPRWLGPIIGAIFGVIVGSRAMRREHVSDYRWLAGGAVIGALAGSVIWLMDAPPQSEERPPSGIGTLFAILALSPGVIPFIGLVFGLPAFLVNRKVTGWPNKASRLGLGLCIALTVVITVAWQVPLN
jgi:hypothetical protein